MTRRLILRQPALDDAAAITRELAGYDIAQWLGAVPHPYVAWHARKFLASAATAEVSGGDIARVIVLRSNPRILVGVVGLRQIGPVTLSLGYWLAARFHGRGMAREAARALVDFGLSTRIAEAVTATTLVDNTASTRVLMAIGLKRQRRRQQLYVRARQKKLPVTTFELKRDEWRTAARDLDKARTF